MTVFANSINFAVETDWLTHWHRDHTDGVQGLLAEQNITRFRSHAMNLAKNLFISNPLQHNDHFHFNDLKVEKLLQHLVIPRSYCLFY